MNPISVRVLLSDPWELGESTGWQPLLGELTQLSVDNDGGRALIKFERPIAYRGTSYQFAVAVPRYEGSSLEAVRRGEKVFCSLTAVSEEHAESESALSTDQWRGGLAFIGELEVR